MVSRCATRRRLEEYLEGIRAAGLAGDEKLARKFYQSALKVMRREDKRRLLEDVYAARHQPLENVEALPEEADASPNEDRPRQRQRTYCAAFCSPLPPPFTSMCSTSVRNAQLSADSSITLEVGRPPP